MTLPVSPVFAALRDAARQRILILDGAMGTQIQQLGLAEADFRGHGTGCGCGCHPPASGDHPQQGNNDLLNLTQPQAIEDIHYRYAMAGADIVETNTFSSTTIAQADYGMESAVYDLNYHGARWHAARWTVPPPRMGVRAGWRARSGRRTAPPRSVRT